MRRVMMIENATLETFAAHINSKFWLLVGQADRLELELVKALDVGSSERQTQFSLTFRAPENAPLIQGIYSVEHANLGEFDIFLVPIGKDEESVFYEAVFNRIVNR